LAAWIDTRMHERHAALFLSRSQAAHSEAQSERGRESGKARGADQSHPGLSRLIRSCLKRGENPRGYVAEWTEAYGVSRSTVYDLINRIENK
jgi:hypothetical protein